MPHSTRSHAFPVATAPTPPAPTLVIRALVPSDRDERIRHLPVDARAALERFQSGGDPMALEPVVFAILDDFIPHPSPRPLAELPGNTRLIDDLGFDSLAITEVVFFAEDLFAISISNQEIVQVRSLDDLSGFIRRKVAMRSAR